MQLYWVSAIIQNKGDTKPWLSIMTDGEIKLEDAMKTIAKARNNHNVLSAWIDVFDENNVKQTVFHECYIDTFGNMKKRKKKGAEQYEHISKLFEELKAYRAIGTIEEFKALKEKSMARKPLPKGTHKGIDNFYCPNCNHPLTNRHEQCELPYCDICGQKLDWGEEE